ncbi:HNH endonuclease [Gluconobacter thailandicus]|uniref:HNH endonuclease n=1 Tax=Gluconobacter thailandicus TaxID=257438 RepID=A0AAP9ERJ5_GLUTH|nr:HNH endonuclease [Gluconobacter thailandicus]QEH96381.1 HNH endonuclease [Gluconobacter thailandicus]
MGRNRVFEKRLEPSGEYDEDVCCALCGRPIPSTARSSRHHLTPKLKGGAQGETVRLHQICHNAIHAHFSEAELAVRLTEPEALREDAALAPFLSWIRKKPADFHAPTRRAASKRGPRRGRMA